MAYLDNNGNPIEFIRVHVSFEVWIRDYAEFDHGDCFDVPVEIFDALDASWLPVPSSPYDDVMDADDRIFYPAVEAGVIPAWDGPFTLRIDTSDTEKYWAYYCQRTGA